MKVFHEVYDKLFQDMNRVRIENGYEPVNYLQGYFPHFQENEEGGSILQKFARAAGIEGDVSPLPATINGLTANFKPGIRYMANIQNRLGYATAYDALQGFDRYIEVATDVIFHTADIQRLRALATQIRYRASDEGLKQRIDAIMMNPFLNPDEANEQVTNLTKEGRYGLSNFVDELDEYTNPSGGKEVATRPGHGEVYQPQIVQRPEEVLFPRGREHGRGERGLGAHELHPDHAGVEPGVDGGRAARHVGYAEKLQDGGRAGFCVDVHQQPQRLRAAGHEHDG